MTDIEIIKVKFNDKPNNMTLGELKKLLIDRKLRGFSSYARLELINLLKYCQDRRGGYAILNNYNTLYVTTFTYNIHRKIVFFLNKKDLVNIKDDTGSNTIVCFRLANVPYGNNKVKLHPIHIYDAKKLILSIQKNYRKFRYCYWRKEIEKDLSLKGLSYENDLLCPEKTKYLKPMIKFQAYFRGYLCRKKVDFSKLTKFRETCYFYPINKQVIFEGNMKIGDDNYNIKLQLIIRPWLSYDKMYSGNVRFIINGDYIRNFILYKIYILPEEGLNIFGINIPYCRFHLRPEALSISFKSHFLGWNINTILYCNNYRHIENCIKNNFSKKIFYEKVISILKVDNIIPSIRIRKPIYINNFTNFKLLQRVCMRNGNLRDIIKSLTYGPINSNLSCTEVDHKKLRLSYTLLSLGKILVSDKIVINSDLIIIIRKHLWTNPRFWQKGLQNKWNHIENIGKQYLI